MFLCRGRQEDEGKKRKKPEFKSLVVVSFIEVGFNAVFKAWEKWRHYRLRIVHGWRCFTFIATLKCATGPLCLLLWQECTAGCYIVVHVCSVACCLFCLVLYTVLGSGVFHISVRSVLFYIQCWIKNIIFIFILCVCVCVCGGGVTQEGFGLSVTRTASANQNVTNNISRKKPEE